ncbi:MAG: glycosylhydrolase-like jelly roll fold domain-containing protein, partial [Saprospiraceae bacterium]
KDRPEEAIKYFAGTAAYRKNINLSKDLIRPNLNVTLDLGTVHIVDEVRLNGKEVATLWMPPFTVDITDFIKMGNNELAILVTNQWSNHLIGDERFAEHYDGYKLGKHAPNPDLFMPKWYTNNEPMPAGPRTTFTTAPFYKKDDPLIPSGLVGPVQLRFSTKVNKQ